MSTQSAFATASDAARYAGRKHRGQVDKAGRPYVEHLHQVAAVAAALARQCPSLTPAEVDEVTQVAWLHDTIEDTDTTAEDLRAAGFSPKVALWVLNLSKPLHRVRYDDWIACLADFAELPVLLVKIADLTHNSDPERLARLPAADRDRLARKYAGAAERLRAAARAKGLRA